MEQGDVANEQHKSILNLLTRLDEILSLIIFL